MDPDANEQLNSIYQNTRQLLEKRNFEHNINIQTTDEMRRTYRFVLERIERKLATLVEQHPEIADNPKVSDIRQDWQSVADSLVPAPA